MSYIKKECQINDKIEVEKYYPARYGAPGMPREKKEKKTPEEMARQNFWKRCQYLRRTMELNFKGGDLHVTLACRTEDRPSKEDAPAVIREFRDKVAREYKKRGWEFKYIITCETGSRGAVHWHMITNNMQDGVTSTWDIIRKYWTRGRPWMVPMDENREYGQLADYIVKETGKRIKQENTIEKLSYMASRNLIRPVEKKKKVDARRWNAVPVPPKGYRLKEESLLNGFNKYTGLPYQKYTLYRIDDGKRKGGGRGGT